MEIIPSIEEIERRARAIGADFGELCADAGIDASTFFRWRRKKVSNPLLPNYVALIKALERAEAGRVADNVESVADDGHD